MSSVVDQVMAQQQKRASQSSSFESTDLTKYFTIALPQGITRGEKTFRMLPPKNDELVFVELWFHTVKVGGKQRKLYDPGKNDGKPSPLNEVYNVLKSSNDQNDKALARNYRPRMFYVIKGIEREKENEGVKFWRFPHDDKGGGIFDMISPIFKKLGDITDANTGRDLSISLAKVKNPKGGEYTAISSILPNDPTPLSADAQLMAQWLADPMTWKNVYKVYDTEYLLLVAEGHTPMWSEEGGGKWVPKPEVDGTEGSGTQDNIGAAVGETPTAQTEHPTVAADTEEISPDDLPF